MLSLVFVLSLTAAADTKEAVALKYFEFLFFEDQVREEKNDEFVGEPIIASFYSAAGHRMIVVSSRLKSGKSYFALMSVNERNMGLLSWKQRGYGRNPDRDVELFKAHDGQEFDFHGW